MSSPDRPLGRTLAGIRAVARRARLFRIRVYAKLLSFRFVHGENVAVGPRARFKAFDRVTFGSNVRLGADFYLETALDIGSDTLVSSRVSIIGRDHLADTSTPFYGSRNFNTAVRIGSRCWIGYGVTIIGPLSICDDTIIGAGTVVTKSIDEPGTYVGIPARLLRRHDSTS